jgi:hypothetical protein
MYKQEKNIDPEFSKRPGTNPFRTPEGYFDSLEDRIMGKIQIPRKKETNSGKIIRILKPVAGIAACLTLVYLLIDKPVMKNNANSEVSSVTTPVTKDDSAFNFSLIDESTLVNAIFAEEQNPVAEINSDDMLAYLSTGMNEVEIYSEIQN